MNKSDSAVASVFGGGLLFSCHSTQPDAADSCISVGENESIVEVRRGGAFSGSAVTLQVYIDDQEVGCLENGQTARFAVPNGQHAIRVQFRNQKREAAFAANSQTIIFSTGFDGGFHLSEPNAATQSQFRTTGESILLC